jgi:hypothetical protein
MVKTANQLKTNKKGIRKNRKSGAELRVNLSDSKYKVEVVEYSGVISFSVLQELLQELEFFLRSSQEDRKLERKVMRMAVEAFYNVYYHGEINGKLPTGHLKVDMCDNIYTVSTSNNLSGQKAQVLKTRLDEICSMDRRKLDMEFLQILMHGPRKSSGAGLGLLQMVRKNEEVSYEFINANPQVQYNLKVKINR